MTRTAFQLARICAVIVLVCAAAALATPKGRMPLALRGVAKLFHIASDEQTVPAWKKALAFALILAAVALALVRF